MIYLFDDKKNRQVEAGWDLKRFNQFADIIKPIYLYSEIEDESIRREIFSSENTVLFHESFFDNILNKHQKDSIEIRNKLNEFSSDNKDFQLVFFSGSKNTRNLTENIGHVPVSILYQNLDVFIKNARNGINNLRYLLFGINHEVEEILLRELENANKNIEDSLNNYIPINNNFIAVTQMGEIEIPFDNAVCETFFTSDITDEYNNDIDMYCTDMITKWFSYKEYDNIFIPISFGSTLSDFNGLRFATHIRCSKTPNQLKNIFIYSFVDYPYLINNEFFDILKTQNVNLIEYKKDAFYKSLELKQEQLIIDELPRELKKLNFIIPKNYEDNHSIANEWGIMRWSNALDLDVSDFAIENIKSTIYNNLYFKYLTTIYSNKNSEKIKDVELKLKNNNGRILYIDDEAEKGWFEIFCHLLCDNNNIDLEHLDDEFNSKKQNEIISISIDKVKSFNPDVVVLDLRLHAIDFDKKNIDKITGYKILKEIKKHNKGIQIIIFSATNKIWNLQALQEAGADGFIIKEAPENSVDSDFTFQSIKNIIYNIDCCLSDKYLQQIEFRISSIKEIFNKNPLIKYYPNNQNCLRGLQYQNILLTELNSIYDILNSRNESRFNHAMLMQFKIIECLVEIFIPENKEKKWIFWDNKIMQYYYIEDGRIYKPNSELKFYDSKIRKKIVKKIPDYEYNSTRNKIDCLIEEKFNLIDKSEIHFKLKELIDYRNDFIHPKDRLKLTPLTSNKILIWMDILNNIIKSI